MKLAAVVVVMVAACRTPVADTEEHMPVPVHVAHPAVLSSEPPPLGPLPRDVHPLHEALDLSFDPSPAGEKTYPGIAHIDVQLDRPRSVIWLHGRDLQVTGALAMLPSGEVLTGRYEQVDPSGVAKVVLPREIAGRATLHLVFRARYDAQLVGVYRAAGAIFSKFEAIYARRAFPCFDEPAFKIPFDVTLLVPKGATAISNMPLAGAMTDAGPMQRATFQTTPPLPTYLVAFAVGAFDREETVLPPNAVRSVPLPIGTVTLAGKGVQGAFARAEAAKLVEAEERYFGIAFPFPKLDLVAVPEFQSGAMENAGAIFFRDSYLLVDDAVTTLAQRETITSIVAHELAHMWFGDLVTMSWWDDLWLNEGFATFLGNRTVRTVRPEFEIELGAVSSANGVMANDGLASARRVRQPIASTDDITNAFDGITYSKGSAILTMLEHAIGDEPFRQGVHDYLIAHARGNATTADLVAALSKAAGRDLAPIATSFLDQPGVPSIAMRAVCEAGQGRVELAQSRWHAAGAQLPGDPAWVVPVCVKAGIGARVVEECTVLAAKTGAIAMPGCADWVMPNARAAGYYHASLDPAGLAALRDRGAKQLAVGERLALSYDLDAGFRSGELAAADVLAADDALASDPHPTIAVAAMGHYDFIADYIADDAQRKIVERHVQKLYAPMVRALGWHPRPGEPTGATNARPAILSALALWFGDAAILREAAKLGLAAPPDLQGLANDAAVRTGGAKAFEQALARLFADDDAQLRGRLLSALGQVREPALVARALDLALDPRLRSTERLSTLGALAAYRETRDAAWAWLVAHYDQLAPLLPDRYGGYLPGMFVACDAKRREELRAFFEPRIAALTGGPRNLAQALERSSQCEARVATQRASVARYLSALR